jgi:hypothetical protein
MEEGGDKQVAGGPKKEPLAYVICVLAGTFVGGVAGNILGHTYGLPSFRRSDGTMVTVGYCAGVILGALLGAVVCKIFMWLKKG